MRAARRRSSEPRSWRKSQSVPYRSQPAGTIPISGCSDACVPLRRYRALLHPNFMQRKICSIGQRVCWIAQWSTSVATGACNSTNSEGGNKWQRSIWAGISVAPAWRIMHALKRAWNVS